MKLLDIFVERRCTQPQCSLCDVVVEVDGTQAGAGLGWHEFPAHFPSILERNPSFRDVVEGGKG